MKSSILHLPFVKKNLLVHNFCKWAALVVSIHSFLLSLCLWFNFVMLKKKQAVAHPSIGFVNHFVIHDLHIYLRVSIRKADMVQSPDCVVTSVAAQNCLPSSQQCSWVLGAHCWSVSNHTGNTGTSLYRPSSWLNVLIAALLYILASTRYSFDFSAGDLLYSTCRQEEAPSVSKQSEGDRRSINASSPRLYQWQTGLHRQSVS